MIRVATACIVCAISCGLNAQAPAESSQPQIAIANASPITYPPPALAARVSGDVNLAVDLRADGTVSHVTVVSGPQMLLAVAVESARKSTFACSGCTASGAKFHLTYSFRLGPPIGCSVGEADKSIPRFTYTSDVVTIEAQPHTVCDPAAEITRVRARSPFCLFLWRCGWRRVD